MKNTFVLAACMAALLLAGCATTGGGDNPDPRPNPRPFPDCQMNPWDPFCRPPMPPIPPIPHPLPPRR